MVQQDKTAVMLVNLGTPDAPEPEAIRSYLKEFLSDPRVVDLPRWLWLPILNGIILRTRPPKLVHKYEMIWGVKDGPIRAITTALANRLQSIMPAVHVHTAMTYGKPSIRRVLDDMKNINHIIVVPLFPQYAGATTGAVRDALARALDGRGNQWKVDVIDDYHAQPEYIDCIAGSIRRSYAFRKRSPKVVFSFHGIPKSQANRGDPYPEQCRVTAALVAATLELPQDRWMVTFQSRFGPAEWLTPYTDETMGRLPKEGVKDVLVVCPGFATDCLETLEEIRMLNRDIFLAAGGESFGYVKALNASWDHTRFHHALIQKRLTA